MASLLKETKQQTNTEKFFYGEISIQADLAFQMQKITLFLYEKQVLRWLGLQKIRSVFVNNSEALTSLIL